MCCPSGAAPYLAADHDDEGTIRSIDGVSFYQVGSGASGLLFLPDIWGWNGGRTRALADDFAKKGLSVWVPKLLVPPHNGGTDGDGVAPSFSPATDFGGLVPTVKDAWCADKLVEKMKAIVKSMKAAGVKKIGVVGFCYGGWTGMYLAKEVELVGCACPHPSIHLEGVIEKDPVALAKTSKCPWALFPCGKADAGGDPDMYDADGALYKALEEKFPGKNVTKRFSDFAHGFVTRGAIKTEGTKVGDGDDVKAAVEECIVNITEFFVRRGLLTRKAAGLPAPPPKLKKPKFAKVKSIKPDSKGLNLMLKAVKCEAKEDNSGWIAVLGDETGVVKFSLKSEELADLCKTGNSVRVQNAKVLMLKGFIHVIVDKWGVFKAADEALDFTPSESNDLSATEYELRD